MPEPVDALLQTDDAVLASRWHRLQAWFGERFGREKPNLEAMLFLVGIQSTGRGYEPRLEKEAKQDLIMEGTYCAFETIDLYQRIGADAEGHWIWERTDVPLPKLSVEDQEKLLRLAVLRYFDDVIEPDVRP